jgi:CRP-like cAMP-binding protein
VAHSPAQPSTVRNHLLTALPPASLSALLPKLTAVELPQRQILHAPEAPIEAIYFPETGMVSLVAGLEEGGQGEVGVIGREGMVGLPLVMGVESSFIEAMVQLPGTALRMTAGAFRHELGECAPLKALLLRYNEGIHAQVSQTAACNGRHALESRLARWLLMAHDRTDGDDLPLTQEFLAMMLGVQRPSVTITAGLLQRAGLLRYANGLITVLDRPGLEAASCECYRAVQRRFATLMGPATG